LQIDSYQFLYICDTNFSMKKIKTALASFGMSGKLFHGPFLQLNPGFELYAVWERSKNLAEAVYPNIITYRTFEDLLADEAIDLVIINTPNLTHFDLAKQALLAGKHIVVEKPFTVTTAQAQELIDLSLAQNKKISVYQNRRWDSDFLTVQKVVNDNLLGNIVEAEFHYDRFNPVLSPKAHKETGELGTGILYDLGPHLIDQALTLFGMPNAVFADFNKIRQHSAIDDYMEILLYYPLLRVRLKASILVKEALPAFAVHGDKGSFIKSRADMQEARLLKNETADAEDWGTEPDAEKGLLHTEIAGETIREQVPTQKGSYMNYYDLLYQALANDEPLPVTAQDGFNVMLIIEKANLSAVEKRVVEIG